MKQILRTTRAVTVARPLLSLRYPRGTDVFLGENDTIDEEGWHIQWGEEKYTVPRNYFQVLTVYTKHIRVETLVDEAGQFIETREKVSDE